MNEEIMEVTNNEATVVENPVEETQSTELKVSDDTKSLAKDLGEMAVVGLVIYVFCKAVDWLIDKIKLGIKKFKEKRAEKKAQKAAQQQAAAPVAQVANVQATETQATENVENKQ